jgi:hypothetical protein
VDRLFGCNIKPGMYLWIDYLVVILNQGCTCRYIPVLILQPSNLSTGASKFYIFPGLILQPSNLSTGTSKFYILPGRLLGCNIKPGMYLWIDYLVVILNQGCTYG